MEFPIDGIPVLDWQCLRCDHYVVQSEAMRRHVRSYSQQRDDALCREKCKVQSPFSGRLKKCFSLADRAVTVMAEDNDSAWNVVAGMLKRKRHLRQLRGKRTCSSSIHLSPVRGRS